MTQPARQDVLDQALAAYADLVGGVHHPVYRVLAMAARAGAWGIGSAQCQDALKDPFSRRMMSDDEEGALKVVANHFEQRRTNAGFPLATWSTATGRWEASDTRPIGAWRVVGWKEGPSS